MYGKLLNIVDNITQSDIQISAISMKIPMVLFAEIEKSIQKLIWNFKGSRIAKTILKKRNKIGGLTISKFQFSRSVVSDYLRPHGL